MKKLFSGIGILVFSLAVSACGDDDGRSCTICSSDQTSEFKVCRESNGEASVNGEDTDTDYDVYLTDLEAAGAECGV